MDIVYVYEYSCRKCGYEFMILHNPAKPECPCCGSQDTESVKYEDDEE